MGTIEDKRKHGYSGDYPWKARWRLDDGTQRSRAFRRRSDAQRFLAEQDARRLRGDGLLDPRRGRTLFHQTAQQWLASLTHLRERSLANNQSIVDLHLNPRFGANEIRKVSRDDVRQFMADQLAGDTAPSTVGQRMRVLHNILQFAVEEQMIGSNPAKGVRHPSKDRPAIQPLTLAELDHLAGVAPRWFAPTVLTAGLVGLRWSEIAGLGVEHVDLARRRIRVERQLSRKVYGPDRRPLFVPLKTRTSYRTVSMPAALAEVLEERLASPVVDRWGLVFPTSTGNPVWLAQQQRAWARAKQAAGVQRRLRFHDLRHTSVALAIAAGAHPTAIKERLGHSSIQTTLDTYGFMFPSIDSAVSDGLDEAYRQLRQGL